MSTLWQPLYIILWNLVSGRISFKFVSVKSIFIACFDNDVPVSCHTVIENLRNVSQDLLKKRNVAVTTQVTSYWVDFSNAENDDSLYSDLNAVYFLTNRTSVSNGLRDFFINLCNAHHEQRAGMYHNAITGLYCRNTGFAPEETASSPLFWLFSWFLSPRYTLVALALLLRIREAPGLNLGPIKTGVFVVFLSCSI